MTPPLRTDELADRPRRQFARKTGMIYTSSSRTWRCSHRLRSSTVMPGAVRCTDPSLRRFISTLRFSLGDRSPSAFVVCIKPISCLLLLQLLLVPVMWSETVGLRTRPVWDQKIALGLGLQVWCCFVKHDLVTFVDVMILKDTATYNGGRITKPTKFVWVFTIFRIVVLVLLVYSFSTNFCTTVEKYVLKPLQISVKLVTNLFCIQKQMQWNYAIENLLAYSP